MNKDTPQWERDFDEYMKDEYMPEEYREYLLDFFRDRFIERDEVMKLLEGMQKTDADFLWGCGHEATCFNAALADVAERLKSL